MYFRRRVDAVRLVYAHTDMTASKQNRMMHPQSTDARRNAQQVKIEALKVEVAQLELDLQ